MIEIAIVVAAALVALGVGWYMQQRAPDAPSTPTHSVPDQVDRADFARPDAPWLIAVFTSETCQTCARVWRAASDLAGDDVATDNVEVTESADLHDRYHITAVPAVIIVDSDGVTRASFLGPPSAADLARRLDEVRYDSTLG